MVSYLIIGIIFIEHALFCFKRRIVKIKLFYIIHCIVIILSNLFVEIILVSSTLKDDTITNYSMNSLYPLRYLVFLSHFTCLRICYCLLSGLLGIRSQSGCYRYSTSSLVESLLCLHADLY